MINKFEKIVIQGYALRAKLMSVRNMVNNYIPSHGITIVEID